MAVILTIDHQSLGSHIADIIITIIDLLTLYSLYRQICIGRLDHVVITKLEIKKKSNLIEHIKNFVLKTFIEPIQIMTKRKKCISPDNRRVG